jgi:hypothetical protein
MFFLVALRGLAYSSLAATAFIMWYPGHAVDGITTGRTAQTVAFAINALLFAILENARPENYPPDVAANDFVRIVRIRWARHILRLSALFVLYAAFLELGQAITPHRTPRLTGFMENAGTVLLTGAIVYAIARIMLSNHRIRRLTIARLTRAAVSFRAEAHYAGALRDKIQEAYAVSLSPLSVEMRAAKVAELLSEALGVEMPTHHEEVLTSAFGARVALAPPGSAQTEDDNPQLGFDFARQVYSMPVEE